MTSDNPCQHTQLVDFVGREKRKGLIKRKMIGQAIERTKLP